MNSEPIKILFAGDFCPVNRTESLALAKNYNLIFNDIIDVFVGNDINAVNLECPLTLSKSKRLKTGPHQKAHPETIEILKYAGVKLVAMANNHIMDYGSEGVEDTLRLLEMNRIKTVGIGKCFEDAAMEYSLMISDKKIAILNYAENEFLTTPDGQYCCNPLDKIKIFYDIESAKSKHDFTIVVIHGGNEYYGLPSPRIKKLCRFIVDLGADAIVNHHTHIFSGYEIYNSKPIFYGLGNFVYDWPGKRNSTWNEGYIVKLELGEAICFKIIPYTQNNEKPGVFKLNPREKELFQQKMIKLNTVIDDDERLEDEFRKYCDSVYDIYSSFIEPSFGKKIASLRRRGMFPNIMSRKKRLLFLNIARCESHRDVLIRILKKYE